MTACEQNNNIVCSAHSHWKSPVQEEEGLGKLYDTIGEWDCFITYEKTSQKSTGSNKYLPLRHTHSDHERSDSSNEVHGPQKTKSQKP